MFLRLHDDVVGCVAPTLPSVIDHNPPGGGGADLDIIIIRNTGVDTVDLVMALKRAP